MKIAHRSTKYQKGQSLFEVVVALMLMGVVIIVLVSLAAVSIRTSTYSRNKNQASRYTQEALEWLRSQRDSNWDDFYANASTAYWCLADLNWSTAGSCGPSSTIAGTTFVRQMNLSLVSEDEVDAKVTVYWDDSQGRHEVSSTTALTSWRLKVE